MTLHRCRWMSLIIVINIAFFWGYLILQQNNFFIANANLFFCHIAAILSFVYDKLQENSSLEDMKITKKNRNGCFISFSLLLLIDIWFWVVCLWIIWMYSGQLIIHLPSHASQTSKETMIECECFLWSSVSSLGTICILMQSIDFSQMIVIKLFCWYLPGWSNCSVMYLKLKTVFCAVWAQCPVYESWIYWVCLVNNNNEPKRLCCHNVTDFAGISADRSRDREMMHEAQK